MLSKPKIAIITRHYPPQIDGVGDYTYQLVERLKACHQVSVITSYHSQTKQTNQNEAPLYFIDFESKTKQRGLVNHIKNIKPDVVILQYVGYSFNKKGLPLWFIPIFKTLKSENIKTILTVHETYERRILRIKHWPISILQKLILNTLCKYASHIITTNNLYENQLKAFQKKLSLVRTPSNFETTYLTNKNQITKDEKSKLKKFVIFGNRNLASTLEILNKILGFLPTFTVNIIGKISQQNIENLLKSYPDLATKINIKGILTETEILEEISSANIYMLLEYVGKNGDGGLNSKSGTTATGFMVATPIVSTKGDMTDEIFEDLRNCILIDSSNADVAAKKIVETLINNSLLEQIAIEGKKMYNNEMSWSKAIEEYNQIIYAHTN